MRFFKEVATLSRGQSYWKARLSNGRVLCELDTVTDFRQARTRKVEWLEDLIGSGDLRKVVEVVLCTPDGDVHLPIERPYSVFQLNQGVASLFDGERTKTCQIIGRVENTEGDCTAVIWDALEERLYPEFHTNVLRFEPWRKGVARLGEINLDILGITL
jgi:hypothetical protein